MSQTMAGTGRTDPLAHLAEEIERLKEQSLYRPLA